METRSCAFVSALSKDSATSEAKETITFSKSSGGLDVLQQRPREFCRASSIWLSSPCDRASSPAEAARLSGDWRSPGEAASFAERMAGALIELLDFIGDVPEQRPEITIRSLNECSTAVKLAPAAVIAFCSDALLLARRSMTSDIPVRSCALASTSDATETAAPDSTAERNCADDCSMAAVSSLCF